MVGNILLNQPTNKIMNQQILKPSFFLSGPPFGGKGALMRILRDANAEFNSFSTGDEFRRSKLNSECKSRMKKRGLLSDEHLEHLLAEKVELIGNGRPIIIDGVPRTKEQVIIGQHVLTSNAMFLKPKLILLDYSEEYCRKRREESCEETRGVRDDNEDEAFDRGLDLYFYNLPSILEKCSREGIEILPISDKNKEDHVDKYVQMLDLKIPTVCP